MATDPRKRQKKLERKASKRKSKHEVIDRVKSIGLADRLADAARHPILHCGIADTLWSEGLGQAFLSRQLPNGFVAFASFLVDRYCLGVKDAFADISSRFKYDSKYLGKIRKYRPTSPEALRKLVEGAVEYARGVGLPPHPDYHRARELFGDIDPNACSDEFEFGKDGKPYFVPGPYDTPARCREVMNILLTHCGPDGMDFAMIGGLTPRIVPAPILEHRLKEFKKRLQLAEQESAEHQHGADESEAEGQQQ